MNQNGRNYYKLYDDSNGYDFLHLSVILYAMLFVHTKII